jgi:NADH-quinone oxidoreductase subunit L
MQGNLIAHLWLIPALPLAAAALGALTPRRGRGTAAGAAIAGMLGSLALSIAALATALRAPAEHLSFNFAWFDLGQAQVRLGWLLDPLAAFMAVMVTLVGALIFIFSLGYMKEDRNFARFFCFLSLFAAAMLGLVVSNSLLLLFVCWELVGLASFLLIGFWFEKPEAAAAATKAFITTRIGDLGLLLGLLWLYNSTGTLLLYDGGRGILDGPQLGLLNAHLLPAPFPGFALPLSAAISLLLFCGAIGKSGQFPLHVWLPDAMEGPTPVSALIHAATMVAAGVFLVARVYPLMSADQILPALGGRTVIHALTVVAAIGAITALLGAVIAVAQSDIKRILAFSTISQLGYMMLALGVGSWVAAIFHLLTHAFFKALLFLGAGSVIASTHHEQDIRRLGGLAPRLRATFATFAVGMMALSGVPFLFSGFWSKEAILHAANAWSVSRLPLLAGLAGVVLTAFYMTRLIGEVFIGSPRSESAAHAHESPAVMTVPLAVLALGSVGLGFLGTPAWPWLQSALIGSPVEAHSIFEGGGLMMLSIFLVAAGLGSGWALYWRRTRASAGAPDPIEERLPRIYAFLAARLKIDELYAATFGRLVGGLASLATALDRRVWGGCVDFVAGFGNFAGLLNREADEGGLNTGFNSASEGLRATGRAYSRRQSGEAHGYLKAVAIAFVVLAFLAIAGGGP